MAVALVTEVDEESAIKLIPTDEVAKMVRRVFVLVPPANLDKFEELLESGQMIGRYHDRCFFGTMARAYGLEPEGTRDEIFEEVRKFTFANFGISLHQDSLNAVEQFCFEVRAGENHEKSPVVAQLLTWISEFRSDFSVAEMAVVA